jgi:hypothetical protein
MDPALFRQVHKATNQLTEPMFALVPRHHKRAAHLSKRHPITNQARADPWIGVLEIRLISRHGFRLKGVVMEKLEALATNQLVAQGIPQQHVPIVAITPIQIGVQLPAGGKPGECFCAFVAEPRDDGDGPFWREHKGPTGVALFQEAVAEAARIKNRSVVAAIDQPAIDQPG